MSKRHISESREILRRFERSVPRYGGCARETFESAEFAFYLGFPARA